MAALVHHGGMGTTADGLRAGKPAVIVPFTTDQPFWGRHLHRLGLSPAAIPPKKLTAQRLAAGIRDTIENEAQQRRVQRMGQSIRGEDGVGQAVALVTRYLASGAP
jgi:sterol 3beta-glucosyltransferase